MESLKEFGVSVFPHGEQDGNFKGLFKNKVNKTNIVSSRIKRNQKEVTGSLRENENFRYLLTNRINKTDTDGIKTKILIQLYLLLGGSMRSPLHWSLQTFSSVSRSVVSNSL